METDLPAGLIEAVREGRAVLLLGAGASYGATDENGAKIPLSEDLAKELIKEFLGPEYAGLDFRSAYDYACSSRDVPTVQKYIFTRLDPFYPAEFHELITWFVWAGLVTTNYDLIIERAYKSSKEVVQSLVPNVKDNDGSLDNLDSTSVLYVKIHGCISRHTEVHPPLIASTEQLIAFREGRHGQFTTFLEWAKTKTIVFVGYKFNDSNLRQLLDKIIKEGDNRPRHYIVTPTVLPAVEGYWNDRRISALALTFEQFLRKLDQEIPKSARVLAKLTQGEETRTPFTKFITVPNERESAELIEYFATQVEQITSETDPGVGDPKRFYKGFDLGWFPIDQELDVRLSVVDEVLSEQVIPYVPGSKPSFVIIKGHAGSGKTIALRRLAWEAGRTFDKLCFFMNRQSSVNLERFDEIFSLTNIPIFLFIDNVSQHRQRVVDLLLLASKRGVSLKVVATENYNVWNGTCEVLETHISAEYEMRYLSEKAIDELISKLQKNQSLGHLEQLPPDRRQFEFRSVFGRQLLIALLEATNGVPLTDIIRDEYMSIFPPEARLLYLDICSLHRFGPPVRAGLIARIHDITFEQFEERLFKPLEKIVHLRRDAKTGDYLYEARHAEIASVVYEMALLSEDERFDNLSRIISKLNASFSYDMEALSRIIRSENIERTIQGRAKARQIYSLALENVGRQTVILHQAGLYEMHTSGSLGELDWADELLQEALSIEPYNRSIKHSLAELDLRRSRLAVDPLERESWRRRAVERAGALTAGDSSPYPHHTLLKAAIDTVRDALLAVEQDGGETAVLRLGESIANAEDVLKRGMQKFPNDARLLGEEGELSKVLLNSARAENAFQKAFKANPRSTLLARRLVRILRSKDAYSAAEEVLRKSMEYNPGAQDLHYDLAMIMMDRAPDADQTQLDQILYHLRRSFSPGDKSFQAQFWYARQLCLADRFDEAKAIFDRLEQLPLPFHQKAEVRGIVKDGNGSPRRFSGRVLSFKTTYGFLRCEKPNLTVFVTGREIGSQSPQRFVSGAPVVFDLGFTLRGPTGLGVLLRGV